MIVLLKSEGVETVIEILLGLPFGFINSLKLYYHITVREIMSDSTANLVWARDGYHNEAVEHPAYLLSTNEDQSDCALIKWSSTGAFETISKCHISLGLAPRHRSCVNYDERKRFEKSIN